MKLRYQNQSEVPAELAAHYTQRDGAFVLNVEGAADPAKLDELHSANLALTKQFEEHKQRFQGIDPERVRQLQEAQQLQAGEFEKVLETRLQTAKADFEKQASALASERDSLSQRLAEIQIDQAVLTAATERGLHRSAVPDLLGRARTLFRLVKGVPTAFEADGKTVRQIKDGKPLQPATWVEDLTGEAPHLFAPSGGSAATGDKTAPARSQDNPFARTSWNLTEQMRLLRTDPAKAASLTALAQKHTT